MSLIPKSWLEYSPDTIPFLDWTRTIMHILIAVTTYRVAETSDVINLSLLGEPYARWVMYAITALNLVLVVLHKYKGWIPFGFNLAACIALTMFAVGRGSSFFELIFNSENPRPDLEGAVWERATLGVLGFYLYLVNIIRPWEHGQQGWTAE